MNADLKWDLRFIELAKHVGSWSRDPSTKVGAVIARPDKTVASVGFNGFPRGVEDSEERYTDKPLKYKFICHAEANAILTANERLHGYTLYSTPLYPCHECAKMIIQSGIARVVTKPLDQGSWSDSNQIARTIFEEAKVSVDILNDLV